MDSNSYGWYYQKANMPIWLALAPGRWWAELEFHLAGNGRLFLSARRRRSIIWHALYSMVIYALGLFACAYFLGMIPASSPRQGVAETPASAVESQAVASAGEDKGAPAQAATAEYSHEEAEPSAVSDQSFGAPVIADPSDGSEPITGSEETAPRTQDNVANTVKESTAEFEGLY